MVEKLLTGIGKGEPALGTNAPKDSSNLLFEQTPEGQTQRRAGGVAAEMRAQPLMDVGPARRPAIHRWLLG